MTIETSNDLLHNCLKKLYSIETQLVEAIPKLASNADSEDLKNALEEHLEITKNQVDRLEEIGNELDIKLGGTPDKGLQIILQEGNETLSKIEDPLLKDTEIMGGALKVEHYEMAAYQGCIDIALKLDLEEIVEKLQESMSEEEEAADTIQELASEIEE